jgi:hypothetical protein
MHIHALQSAAKTVRRKEATLHEAGLRIERKAKTVAHSVAASRRG